MNMFRYIMARGSLNDTSPWIITGWWQRDRLRPRPIYQCVKLLRYAPINRMRGLDIWSVTVSSKISALKEIVLTADMSLGLW